MKIKLNELRQVIREVFTAHQMDITRSMLASAQQNVNDFVQFTKLGEGDKNDILAGLAGSAKELRGWAPVYTRHYPEQAASAKSIAALVDEFDKMAVKPFSGLFGKGKLVAKMEEMYKQLTQMCEDELKSPQYGYDYQKTRLTSLQARDHERVNIKA